MSDATKLAPIDPAVSREQEKKRKCMALITAVCLFQQIVLMLIHTQRQPPLAHINNVRPSSLSVFFFFPTLYSAKCLHGNLGLLLVRFSIDYYKIYFKSVKQHVLDKCSAQCMWECF